MRYRLITILTSSLLLVSVCNNSAWAGARWHENDRSPRYMRYAEQPGMSLQEAAAMVREQTGGRILSARRAKRGAGRFYRIKVLMPDGVVRSFTVNSGTREIN